MAMTTVQLGATTQGTTFADIIINNVNSVADGITQGFAQFVHDPRALKSTVEVFNNAQNPRKFADAVVMRRIETQKLDDIWNFPLNMTVPTTCPIPWTLVEATVKSQTGQESWEFNIMRTVDFVGRNYVRIVLPEVNCANITDTSVNGASVQQMSDPEHIYLGAWHRDLVPRLISNVSFYPRSNAHKLFEYTGYDIYIHNILFGNAHKEMNDLMAGEDKFELAYDPYRVDGSALGLASFKGIDAWADYSYSGGETTKNGMWSYSNQSSVSGATDYITDYFQLDTTMTGLEFRDVYRHNVWYEAPVAINYHARHSIHEHRLYHASKDIVIPLDILPFGYSVASSLPSAALAGECGYIRLQLYSDWLDRSFYLTKASDVPPLHPIVNHTHYVEGNADPNGAIIGAEGEDPRVGWVNERSLGRYGDDTFVASPEFEGNSDPTPEQIAKTSGFTAATPWAAPGNILNTSDSFNTRDNIVPTRVSFESEDGTPYSQPGLLGRSMMHSGGARKNVPTDVYKGHSRRTTKNIWTGHIASSTTLSSNVESANYNDQVIIYKLSDVDQSYYNTVRSEINVRLMQVGYQTLPCIREFLSKLPNIYITTEWDDKYITTNDTNFDINNDLYIQAIIMWWIPQDQNGNESMRVYANHMIDHEAPIIQTLKLVNEQSQGTTIYDWSMLNLLNCAQMNLNPLHENIGIISFSPSIAPNQLPLAYYDSNISGYLKCTIQQTDSQMPTVNLTRGGAKIISIGVNGVASVNLNLYRLIF